MPKTLKTSTTAEAHGTGVTTNVFPVPFKSLLDTPHSSQDKTAFFLLFLKRGKELTEGAKSAARSSGLPEEGG